MTPAELLAALRRAGPRAVAARATLAHAPDPTPRAAHAAQRAEVAAQLAASLSPGDHRIARWLLEQEIADHEAAGSGASEGLYTLIAALARFERPADAPLLWRARQATPETRAGVEVEQVGRLSLPQVRATLQRLASGLGKRAGEAAAALAWITAASAEGAFADLPAYFAWADARYGLRVAGPT
jgi:hypothetical protein